MRYVPYVKGSLSMTPKTPFTVHIFDLASCTSVRTSCSVNSFVQKYCPASCNGIILHGPCFGLMMSDSCLQSYSTFRKYCGERLNFEMKFCPFPSISLCLRPLDVCTFMWNLLLLQKKPLYVWISPHIFTKSNSLNRVLAAIFTKRSVYEDI